MKHIRSQKRRQGGMFLIEALIAILIFSLGILGMVAMGGTAIAAQSDAQYRSEAVNLAGEIAAQMAINVDRSSPAAFTTSLTDFGHQTTTGGFCNFSGAASGNAAVIAWVARMAGAGALPNATQQIVYDPAPAAHNRVTITVCWQPPTTTAVPVAGWHRQEFVTYINQ